MRGPRWPRFAVGHLWVIGILAGVIGTRLLFLYEPYTFVIGDCAYYTSTGISILNDGDLDLRNQLEGGLEPHEGHISLGTRGEWYPKHPILMPVVTLPLLGTLGINGLLLANVVVLLGLGVALYEVGRLATRPGAAAAGAIATTLGSFLILYDYNYSPNLFACLLLTLSVLAAIHGRTSISGLLAGLSALAATIYFLLVPLVLVHVAWRRRLKGALIFCAAVSVPLIAQAALNYRMFDSPFVSPYMRILGLEDGRLVQRTHTNDFDNPMWEGIRGQLFDADKGLLFTAPILLVAIPGYVAWFKRRPADALLCLAIGEFLFLIFSRYRFWPASHVGNRFLMPLVALSAPAVACSLEFLWHRLTRPRPRTMPPS